MEITVFIAVFKKRDLKASLFKYGAEKLVIIYYFVGECRVSGVAVSAHFYHILILFISEIPVGHSSSDITALRKKIKAVFCSCYSVLKGHMLPDVLGKECGGLTIYCSLAFSIETWVFEQLIPISAPLTGYPLLELVYAVLLTGVGSAIIFKCKASSGGTDIVALILKNYTNMNVGHALLVSDFVIAASTFFVYQSAEKGLFALLGLFAKTFVIDDILDSINMCKAFTIITTKPKEIEEFIIKEMHHGATIYKAEGVYTGEEKQVIITVCKRLESLRLRKKVKEIDPSAFIIITKTSEIMGKGFRDNQI